jgi:hypothetical protein
MDVIAQAVADVIRAIGTRPENVALAISVLANVGMATLIWLMRKEDREDRKAFVSTLNGMTTALTELRIAFASAGIKA